jgi:plastocyanin
MRVHRNVAAFVTAAGVLLAACSTASPRSATPSSAPDPSATTVASSAAATSSVTASVASVSTPPTAVTPTTATQTTLTPAPVTTTTTVADRPLRAGATRLHYEVGPIDIKPGQNNISYTGGIPKPTADGWIVRIAPNLRLANGTVPGVDVIHLHHGVWLNASAHDMTMPGLPERLFAAGEEKTTLALPDGYGYRYQASDSWVLNYMIHNLWPNETQVWITYDLDFIAADAPAAVNLTAARPVWMDVQNGSGYPVFDVLKGSGETGAYTYPDDATAPYGTAPAKNAWTADRDGVLIETAGHLHPGGLHTDLWLRRQGHTAPAGHAKPGARDTAHLFTSDAHYWEPAGAVSWDVAMTATPANWRVAVHKGDVLSTTATYDSGRASWYESMGIMVVWMADAPAPSDRVPSDPFRAPVDAPGQLTHGHLAENDHHGGAADTEYADASQLPSAPAAASVSISDFVYAQGDMQSGGALPTVAPGGTITFDNLDAPKLNGEWHTITACKAPCSGSTGVAFPLADGDVTFDSGQLGTGGAPTAGRTTWTTPADLAAGTYTYFCRIHPFMRGAFRVAP